MTTRMGLAGVILGAALLAFGGCSDDGNEKPTPTATAEASASPAVPTATAVAAVTPAKATPTAGQSATPAAEVAVAVYFVRDENVATAGRAVTAPAVARGALEALLAGPSAAEKGAGMGSAIPAGTRLLGITIEKGLATVDLSKEFTSGGGSLSMTTRVAQVVYTLTQFDTVERVTIKIDGREVEGIGGEGVPAKDLTRDDFRDNTPLILVETPLPGQEVGTEIRVEGESNTFEASISWEVRDGAGKVVREGFTTATSGTGTWGTFAFTIELPRMDTGPMTLVLFERSARDGSPVNVYQVPLKQVAK